jgi:ABC-type branched-subunit amino acid transport system substrate-binding protein
MVVVVDEGAAGTFSEQNVAIAHGAAVAAAQINAAEGLGHGVRIKLEGQDLNDLSEGALRQRLNSDAAAALVLPCDTEAQTGLAARASQFGMLMLAPCDPDPTAEAGYTTYWPVGTLGPAEATGLTLFMHKIGYDTAYIVSATGDHLGDVLANNFRAAAKSNGVTISGSTSVAPSSEGIAAAAKTIKALQSAPAAVFTTLSAPLVNQLASALQADGVEAVLVGTSTLDTPLTLKTDPQALENALVPTYGFVREEAAGQTFTQAYTQRFGLAPAGSFPGLGFETIRVLAAAANKARSASPAAIEHALLAGLTVKGVALADRTYLPNGAGDHGPVGRVSIEKVYDGRFEPLIAVSP